MSFSRQRRSSLALVFCSCPVLCVVKSFIGNPAVGFGVNDLDFPSWLWLLGCIRPPGKILQEPGNPRILLKALQDFPEEELLLLLVVLYFIILLYFYYFNYFCFNFIFIIYFILLFLYYYFLLLCHHHCDTHAHGLIPIKPHPG